MRLMSSERREGWIELLKGSELLKEVLYSKSGLFIQQGENFFMKEQQFHMPRVEPEMKLGRQPSFVPELRDRTIVMD